jgi:hypothetical protein
MASSVARSRGQRRKRFSGSGFGGTDVEVEVAFQREVVAVLLGVDDAGPGRHAGP